MSRFVAASTSGGTPSATRPFLSIYSPAGNGFDVREVAIFNTTVTAHRCQLAKLTSAGTQGAGLTEAKYDDDAPAITVTAFATHTADPAIGSLMHMMSLGAAAGAGCLLTFYDRAIEIPAGTANGFGPVVAAGTPQVSDIHFVWDE